MSKDGIFSGPYFPAFGLNTERYFLSLRIQSKCGETRTRKNSVFGHISRSVCECCSRLKALLHVRFFIFFIKHVILKRFYGYLKQLQSSTILKLRYNHQASCYLKFSMKLFATLNSESIIGTITIATIKNIFSYIIFPAWN